jgi:tetratricopeptide (TPR) repeat protein
VLFAVILEWRRPAAAEWFSTRGAQLEKQSERSTALRDYERAASLNPDSGLAHINLASIYEDVFDYEKAEAEYLAAIRVNRLLAPAYDRLGRLALDQFAAPAYCLRFLVKQKQKDPTGSYEDQQACLGLRPLEKLIKTIFM